MLFGVATIATSAKYYLIKSERKKIFFFFVVFFSLFFCSSMTLESIYLFIVKSLVQLHCVSACTRQTDRPIERVRTRGRERKKKGAREKRSAYSVNTTSACYGSTVLSNCRQMFSPINRCVTTILHFNFDLILMCSPSK